MKVISRGAIALIIVMFSAPIVYGQDLSKYRNFSFGTTLASVSKQVDRQPVEAEVIHQRPALIQELTWYPPQPLGSSRPAEPVEKILFSFNNGELYRMLVTYDSSAIKGLTDEDMIRAVSAKYGDATRPVADVKVTIGGQPATISYAGEAPGLVSGVIQINAMIPGNINSGPQQVVLTIGTNSNIQQVISVAVQ